MNDQNDGGAESKDITKQSSEIIPSAEIANPQITTILATPIDPPQSWFKRHPKLMWTVAGLTLAVTLIGGIAALPNSVMDWFIKWNELFGEKPKLEQRLSKDDIAEIGAVVRKSVAAVKQDISRDDQSYPGPSWHCLVRLNKPIEGRDNYLFDYGSSIESNRFSLYLDTNKNLCARTIQHDGNVTLLRVKPSLSTFQIGNFVYLFWEVSLSPDHCFSRLFINGRKAAERMPEEIAVNTNGTWRLVMGADFNNRNGGVFEMLELLAYSETFTTARVPGQLDYLSRKAAAPSKAVNFFGTNWIARSSRWNMGGDLHNPDKGSSPRMKVYKQ